MIWFNVVLLSSRTHDKKTSALLRYLSWHSSSMNGVANPNPTIQAADILTFKRPQWDVLCDKMKYIIRQPVDVVGADKQGYQVFAYSKVPMRLTAWLTLFEVKSNGGGIEVIRGKFEDYEPFKECKRRLMTEPGECRIKEWGVCPSLRARPNMTAQKQAMAEAEQMAEQLRSEICRQRKEIQGLKSWLCQVRKENQQLKEELSGSKRKAAEMSADESEAERQEHEPI